MAGVATGGNMWKNILIGILTTVVAYSIVNYIKDRKEKKKEKEKIKTETVEAWKSLIKYENLSSVNYYAAFCNENMLSQFETLIYEKDQLAKNYGIISSKKDIDDDLASFANRAIGNTNEIKRILEDYRNDYKNIDPYELNTVSRIKELDSIYAAKMEMARERDMESLQATYTGLVKKYGDVFTQPKEELILTDDNLEGKWKEVGIDKSFTIKADNSFTMEASGNNYPGTWKRAGNDVTFTYDDGSGSITLHFIFYNSKYFRFTIDDESTERQCCKK